MKRVIMGMAFCLLLACPKLPEQPEKAYPAERVYEFSFEEVWATTIKVVGDEFDYPLSAIEKASGVIHTDFRSEVRSPLYYNQKRSRLSIYVEEIEKGKTIVKITNHVEVLHEPVGSSPPIWHVISSDGTRELDVLKRIGERLLSP